MYIYDELFEELSNFEVYIWNPCCHYYKGICRPSSLSELTSIIFDIQLTHLGSKTSICLRFFIEKNYHY